MSILQITDQDLFTSSTQEIPDNVIAAAVYVSPDGEAEHAAILTIHKGNKRLFHYTGYEVLLEDTTFTHSYECKEILFLPTQLLPWFISHCELVKENAQPEYGYFYDGSYYDPSSGDFTSPGAFPQYMTCVGFCINVLNAFFESHQCFDISGWNESSLNKPTGFLENFLAKVKTNYPDVKIEDFSAHIRRILPIEYLAGAFSNDIPITRDFISNIVPALESILKSKTGVRA